MDSALGNNIRKIREIKNIGQQYIADKLNISQPSYHNLEAGKIKLSEEKLEKIARILEVDKEVIKNFNNDFIFQTPNPSDRINMPINISLDEIHALYKLLLKEKDKQINLLKDKIKLLKKKINH
jgi:transcriptional regulator with XRE-family HTH domain